MVISRKFAVMGAVIAALAIGLVAYGLNQHFTSKSTGVFQVDVSEASNLQIEFFGMAPGAGATTGADWCEGNLTSAGLFCVAKVSNATTTLNIDVALAVAAAAAGPGNLRDDLTLAVYRVPSADGTVRDACRAGNLGAWTLILPATALAALPSATVFTEAPAAANHLCFQLEYSGQGYSSSPGSITTSATLSFVGTAQ